MAFGDQGGAQAGGTGRFVAFCVRLCDGQHFPLAQTASATPVETCKAMCPASETRVFFGSEIDRAVAKDGARYVNLDNAFVYREHLVALHGFIKKTRATPDEDLATARKRQKELQR